MDKGFVVEYNDGRVITEEEMEWKTVPKSDIKRLVLRWFGKQWSVPGPNCFQFKRGSVPLYGPSNIQLEYRIIGYFTSKDKITYWVNESTGDMKMKVEPVK